MDRAAPRHRQRFRWSFERQGAREDDLTKPRVLVFKRRHAIHCHLNLSQEAPAHTVDMATSINMMKYFLSALLAAGCAALF
jgi:hypothetical protein